MIRKHGHPDKLRAHLFLAASQRSAVETPPTGWRWRYGWLIVLIDAQGGRYYRSVGPEVTDEGAVRIRDEELASSDRFRTAWLIQKQYDPWAYGRRRPRPDPDADLRPEEEAEP